MWTCKIGCDTGCVYNSDKRIERKRVSAFSREDEGTEGEVVGKLPGYNIYCDLEV